MARYTLKVLNYEEKQGFEIYDGDLKVTLSNKQIVPLEIRRKLIPVLRQLKNRVLDENLETLSVQISTKNLAKLVA